MRQHRVAMWVVPMREYNEDPVFWSLVSATSFFARRRTIYVFFDRGPDRGVERLALGGTSQEIGRASCRERGEARRGGVTSGTRGVRSAWADIVQHTGPG